MKEVNFDWLLQGCHPLSEVAQAYFPCMHNSSAVRSFRKHVKEIADLYAGLLEVGYTDQITTLTPLQIAVLIRYLGLPNQARREMEQ